MEPEPGNTGGGKHKIQTNNIDTTNQSQKGKIRNRITNFFKPFKNPKVLSEIAIFTALATVLSTITIYVMPQGGSITLASMVPIIWLSLRRGPKIGIITCTLYGAIQFVLLPYAINPIQVLLDYFLAFGVLGLAGFFSKYPTLGAAAGVSLRFIMSFISGVVYWAPIYAPNINPYIYSAAYNGSYILPELIITVIAVGLLQASKTMKVYI